MSELLNRDQLKAISKMKNGCILCGGVGSGKSRTAIAYWFLQEGGTIDPYSPMKTRRDLYIITTAKKRDNCEWEYELALFCLSKDPAKNSLNGYVCITIDSWNNIAKYKDVTDAMFIFDEQRVIGYGAWTKSFLKISRGNKWILLSATPGDTWEDYIPVFIANGFYKNKTEFVMDHVIYANYVKFPKIDRYVNIGRLIRLRNSILVDIECDRHTLPHNEDILVDYDINKYKTAYRNRWDPYKNEPIMNASSLCYILRRIVNEDPSRQQVLLELFEKHQKMIIFYNFDYELEILRNLYYGNGVEIAEWNGHKHEEIPDFSKKWVYLVQYTAGCEGWNCITTDTIVFYSQNYSYRVLEQAKGRINRMNTPYIDLYYYHIRSRSTIDIAILQALKKKKKFNERKFVKWDK